MKQNWGTAFVKNLKQNGWVEVNGVNGICTNTTYYNHKAGGLFVGSLVKSLA
jgi:hypothetical protein